jgi:type IV pilus assembly protein PilF
VKWLRLVGLLLPLLMAGCAQKAVAPPPAAPDGSNAQFRAKTHTELGSGYFARAQYGVALEELNEALRVDPGYAPAYNMIGLVYMELREDQQAEQSFTRALQLDPGDSDAHNNFGWFLCSRNRFDESIKQFLAAVKDPLYATPEKALLNAGICSAKKGDAAAAEDFLLKALKVQPQQPQALYNLAQLYFKQGRYAEARGPLSKYLQAAGPTPESLWLAIRLERKLGDRDAEAGHGRQMRKLFPDTPEALLLQGGRYDDPDVSKGREGIK